MAAQDQTIDHSALTNSNAQQTQAGQDALSFQNSDHNHITIHNTILRLFGRDPKDVDWGWGMRLLEKKQLPDIRQRLRDNLGAERLQMQLPLDEQPTWVSRPLEPSRSLQVNGQERGTMDSQRLLIETFGREDVAGKLLILGTPGAGKTTALLGLAEELVCGALDQPQTVIPVMLELSTWRDDSQSIRDWIVAQLVELHGGKPQTYQRYLDNEVLLPLLDGLDELGMERQKRCTIQLNDFAQTYPHLVVCCRVKEFAAAEIKLSNLRGALCLQSLTDSQLQAYLHSRGCADLWQAIQTNPALQPLLADTEGEPGLLRVPLFIKLAADSYDPQQPFTSKADLLEHYLDRQLSRDQRQQDRKERKTKAWAYPTTTAEPNPAQTRHHLRWLAWQLQTNNQVELLIEQMQPSWIDSPSYRWGYRLMVGLMFGLIYGLPGVIFGLPDLLLLGLCCWSMWGLIWVVVDIKPVETFQLMLMLNTARREMFKGLCESLCAGLLTGLLISLFFKSFPVLLLGLIVGILVRLSSGLSHDLQVRLLPNHGIWNSFLNIVWATMFIYTLSVVSMMLLLVAHSVEMQHWLMLHSIFLYIAPQMWLILLVMSLFLGFLFGGGTAVVQHVCLRVVLWQGGYLPWNVARFLNFCTERKLLLRVGGRYRFLHRELLDHLAGLKP